ncbi:Ig-like domain-containing protein [Jejubacter calystegiae]|uniref:Ig-like domain-containing protein n=1 Tax=Jejubacter calystegiae TaxID=2579935 RepID=UPI00143D8776|nr:Ig-like domain-containing protein [Jejubacter calystegiae]
METKTVNVVVLDGKKLEKTMALPQEQTGQPIILNAIKDGTYILAEQGDGVAPENITIKRVGDDLYLSLEGGDPEHPELIIRDYYLNGGELVGKGEDGQYYNYVTAIGQESDSVSADTAIPLALGGESIPGFADGLVEEDDDDHHALLWSLLGVGALGALAGGIALAHHNNNDGSHHRLADITPDVVVNPGKLDSVIDNVGSIQGKIANGGVTDDNKPTFNGSGVAPGNTVIVMDSDGTVIGSTVANESGNWAFTPDSPMSDGSHKISAVVVDGNGNRSEPSDSVIVVIDTVAPAAVDNVVVTDSSGTEIDGGVTNDNMPSLSGKAEPGTVVVISDNGKEIGSAQVDDNGQWNFTPTTPMGDGEHNIEVVAVDDAGNVGPSSKPIPVEIDTMAPDVATTKLLDDVGDTVGVINSGDTTDDNKPTFDGTAEPGATVIISDNGQVIGSVAVGENGAWSYTPETSLKDGDHSFSSVVVDKVGNQSVSSEPIDFTVDTSGIPLTSGSENFESVTQHIFNTEGDTLKLDSGLSVTFVSGPCDGENQNAFTEISSKGIAFFAPAEMGSQAMMLIENSVTKFEFGTGTSAVSFDVNSASAGSTVNYYDADGNLLHSEALPDQSNDNGLQTISWAAGEGEIIASMTIETAPAVGGDVITRVDNFNWGSDAEVASGSEVVSATSAILEENSQFSTEQDYSIQASDGVIEVHGHHVSLSLDALLFDASRELLIADGKEQVAIVGDAGSRVELNSTSLGGGQDWSDAGQVTAGGVVYEIYHSNSSSVELLVQQGIELQHS